MGRGLPGGWGRIGRGFPVGGEGLVEGCQGEGIWEEGCQGEGEDWTRVTWRGWGEWVEGCQGAGKDCERAARGKGYGKRVARGRG